MWDELADEKEDEGDSPLSVPQPSSARAPCRKLLGCVAYQHRAGSGFVSYIKVSAPLFRNRERIQKHLSQARSTECQRFVKVRKCCDKSGSSFFLDGSPGLA